MAAVMAELYRNRAIFTAEFSTNFAGNGITKLMKFTSTRNLLRFTNLYVLGVTLKFYNFMKTRNFECVLGKLKFVFPSGIIIPRVNWIGIVSFCNLHIKRETSIIRLFYQLQIVLVRRTVNAAINKVYTYVCLGLWILRSCTHMVRLRSRVILFSCSSVEIRKISIITICNARYYAETCK